MNTNKRIAVIAQLTKNMIVVDLMRATGWSRERVVCALNVMEAKKDIVITENGNLRLRVLGR